MPVANLLGPPLKARIHK
ncbi:rCG50950, partial [Rattus norvegicus]